MIRIDRGPEPGRLATERRKRLAKAQQAWATGDRAAMRKQTKSGYGWARAPLYRRQSGKCAYCERHISCKGAAVDHFRPKGGAQQNTSAPVDQDHYWWLTWTWENLLVACAGCNTGCKRNQFPIQSGQPRLPLPPGSSGPIPPSCTAVSAERSLLVDPGAEDPLDHIRWLPVDRTLSEEDWEWKPRGITPEGKETIRVLGLDAADQGLFDQVTDYIRRHLLPEVQRYRKAPSAGAWAALCKRFLTPTNPYVGAAWCAIATLVPPASAVHQPPPRPMTS